MSGTKLTQLFLFNPSWGPREGEEEEKVGFHLDMDTTNTNKQTHQTVEQTTKVYKQTSCHKSGGFPLAGKLGCKH